MSKNSTKKSAFIDARLFQVRLVSEKTTSAPAFPNNEPQQVQLRTDTTTGFSIGLDKPENPSVIVITIGYKASLNYQDGDRNVIEYEATHEAQFSLEGWTGFDDWTNMPSDAIAPYLTFVHNIALRKAEGTILEMGVKGVSLPQPERFDGALSPLKTDQVKSEKNG